MRYSHSYVSTYVTSILPSLRSCSQKLLTLLASTDPSVVMSMTSSFTQKALFSTVMLSHGVRKPHQIFLTSPLGATMVLNLVSLLVSISSRKSKRSLAAYVILACTEMTALGYPKHRHSKQSASKKICAVFSVIMVWKLQLRSTQKPSTSSMSPSTCLMGNTWPTPDPETSQFMSTRDQIIHLISSRTYRNP